MSILPAFKGLFASHTFGRNHNQPPPLSNCMQTDHLEEGSSGASAAASDLAMSAQAGVSQDLDHLVRSVGEW